MRLSNILRKYYLNHTSHIYCNRQIFSRRNFFRENFWPRRGGGVSICRAIRGEDFTQLHGKVVFMRNAPRWDHDVARSRGPSCKVCWQRLPSVVLSVLLGAATAVADVKLPALISDNMVLQQGRQVAMWGTADAGEQVTVSLGEQ